MGRKRKDKSDEEGTEAGAHKAKRPSKWEEVMGQPNPARVPSIIDGKMTAVTVSLDAEALADLVLISDRCVRRTGCEPSRSQIIRATLRAFAQAVE